MKTPKSAREQIDELVDWYQKYKPEAGKVIVVTVSADTLARFAERIDPDSDKLWRYRGRTLQRAEA